MSDSPTLAAKATLVVIGRTIGALSRVLAIVLLARLLSKEDFGLISFVLLTYITVSDLVQLGLSESVFYFVEKLPRRCHRALALRLAGMLLLLALAAVAILLVVAWAATSRGYPVGHLFVPLLMLVLLELPTMPILNLMIAIDRVQVSALLNGLFGLLLLAALAVPAWLQLPLAYIPYCLVGYGLLRLLISALIVNRTIAPASQGLPAGLTGDLLRYSVPLGIGTIFSKLNKVVDKYVVMWLLPVAIFAEYSVGSWEIPVVPLIAGSVASVMMTRLVSLHLEGRPQELLALWSTAVRKISLIVLPIMVLLVVVAKELVVVLFSERYENAAIIFAIYSLILFQRVTDYGAVLKAIDATRWVTRWLILTLLINLLLSVPLVLLLGAPGAALSTLLAVVAGWFYVLGCISRALAVPYRRVFPFSFYLKTLLIAVLSALPCLLFDGYWQGPYWAELAIKIPLYTGSYFVLSTTSGICQRSDWSSLGRMFSRRTQRA